MPNPPVEFILEANFPGLHRYIEISKGTRTGSTPYFVHLETNWALTLTREGPKLYLGIYFDNSQMTALLFKPTWELIDRDGNSLEINHEDNLLDIFGDDKGKWVVDDHLKVRCGIVVKIACWREFNLFFDGREPWDVVLIVQERRFHVFKGILSQKSPKFAEMFDLNPTTIDFYMTELDTNEGFHRFLELMYEEEIDLNWVEDGAAVANLARRYDVRDILDTLEDRLLNFFPSDADKFNYAVKAELKGTALKLLQDVTSTEELKKFDYDEEMDEEIRTAYLTKMVESGFQA